MGTTYDATLVAITPAATGQPTLTELCGLNWDRFTTIDELGAPGTTTIQVPVDKLEDVGKARLRDLTVAPCELWVRKTVAGALTTTTTIIVAGIVTACHIFGRELVITAPGLMNYLNYWLRDTDYTASGLDQATIVRQLCDTWQASAYGDRGIVTTGLTATGVTRDLTLSGRDGKFIMPVIQTMGGRNNGFDLTVDPATRALTMWSPRRGTDLTSSVFLDSRSIGVPELSWTVAPGTVGSEVFASSNSTTGATLTTIQSNTGLRATFGRSYVTRSYNDISVQATLDDHAARTLVDVGSQLFTLAPTLLPVSGFSHGDFNTGDLITYDFDAGLGRQTFTVRVASIELSLDSGRETLKVGML